MQTNFKPLVDDTRATSDLGPLVVIRGYKQGGLMLTFNGPGNKTEEALKPGTIIEGIYEGAKEETGPRGKPSIEYKIRGDNNTLYMLKGCSSLNNAKTGLAAVQEGALVQVTFNSVKTTKSGNDYVDFVVAVADSAI